MSFKKGVMPAIHQKSLYLFEKSLCLMQVRSDPSLSISHTCACLLVCPLLLLLLLLLPPPLPPLPLLPLLLLLLQALRWACM
jgi:hypothetical protein